MATLQGYERSGLSARAGVARMGATRMGARFSNRQLAPTLGRHAWTRDLATGLWLTTPELLEGASFAALYEFAVDGRDSLGRGPTFAEFNNPEFKEEGVFLRPVTNVSDAPYLKSPSDSEAGAFNISGSESFVVSAWVRVDVEGPSIIVSKREGTGGTSVRWQLLLHTPPLGPSLELRDTVADGSDGVTVRNDTSNSVTADDQFHHIVGMVDRTTDKGYMYVDQVLEKEEDVSSIGDMAHTGPLWVGRTSLSTSKFYGHIKQLFFMKGRIWTAEEVKRSVELKIMTPYQWDSEVR